MNLIRLILLFVVIGIAPACLAQTRVDTQIGFTGIRILATTRIDADAQVVWATLTDYNHLADFVPGMTKSQLISSPRPGIKLIEQEGEGGLLSLVLPDDVVLTVEERPYSLLSFRSVSGFATSMAGQWRISGDRAPVLLTYQVRVVPLLPPPPALTDSYIQHEVSLRLDAVAREAERRMRARNK
jgi:hypothetical protein